VVDVRTRCYYEQAASTSPCGSRRTRVGRPHEPPCSNVPYAQIQDTLTYPVRAAQSANPCKCVGDHGRNRRTTSPRLRLRDASFRSSHVSSSSAVTGSARIRRFSRPGGSPESLQTRKRATDCGGNYATAIASCPRLLPTSDMKSHAYGQPPHHRTDFLSMSSASSPVTERSLIAIHPSRRAASCAQGQIPALRDDAMMGAGLLKSGLP